MVNKDEKFICDNIGDFVNAILSHDQSERKLATAECSEKEHKWNTWASHEGYKSEHRKCSTCGLIQTKNHPTHVLAIYKILAMQFAGYRAAIQGQASLSEAGSTELEMEWEKGFNMALNDLNDNLSRKSN